MSPLASLASSARPATSKGNPFAPRAPEALARANVLHLIAPGEVGGAESVVRSLASRQRALGARVTVAAVVPSARAASGFVDALERSRVEATRVVVGGRDYRREQKIIASICEELRPDILHSHGYRTDVIDALYLRRKMPIVTTVHGFTGGDLRNRLYQWVQCRAYRRFDAVVAVSQPLVRQLEGQIDSRCLHLLPNAYSRDEEVLSRATARATLGLSNDDFVVGWVGRLSPEKGPDVLVEAFRNSEMPGNVHAVFLGDGPLAMPLQERAAHLGLAQRISWMGCVPNAGRLLRAFDVIVLSSRTEGTPMVLLEAMAAGTPIIATRVGGVPDLLPARTALLISPESPVELRDAIREVLADPEEAMSRAEAARRHLDAEYQADAWVDEYEQAYQDARALAARRLS